MSSNKSWVIREAHSSDLDGVVRLVESAKGQVDTRPVDLVETLIHLRSSVPAMIAAVGEDVVGVAVASISGDVAWIETLTIAPAWRKQGIGSALIRALEERLLHLGARKISTLLGVGQVGEEALGNRGFQATHGLVLYEKLEPLMPSEVGVLDDWGGDLLSSENWDLVAGMSAEKTLIESRIVGPLADPITARNVGLLAPATVMLFGPPGTGKTTFARGIAGLLGWPFVELLPSKLASAAAGLASELRRAFTELAALEHVVVFIDEFDEIASRRQSRPEMQSVVNELLKAIPPFRSQTGRLLICATNFIDTIDPAVIRPGRFDLIVPIGPPDQIARNALWSAAIDRLDHREIDIVRLASESAGFTPGDVALTAQRAAATAFDRIRAAQDPPWVSNEDLFSALQRTAASVSVEDQEQFAQESLRHSRV
ncbi:MAG: bifunctional GNAT family N-acetyltransferase/ATP-binding protein [Actinobacteria bacterium]|nr:bifunctional GNAT family N-acetyltransferase/ATP-binding protein [Actinomycetota bacterium]